MSHRPTLDNSDESKSSFTYGMKMKAFGKVGRERVVKEKKVRMQTESTSLPISSENENSIREYKEVAREILKQGKRLNLSEQTYYLAMCYYQAYLSGDHREYFPQSIQKVCCNMRILATASLFLSSKFNDILPPTLDQICYPYGRIYKKYLVELEKHILERNDYQCFQTSPYHIFLDYFAEETQSLNRCCEIFERAILEDWALLYGWELVTKAVVNMVKPTQFKTEELSVRMQIKDLSARIAKLIKQR